MLEEIRFKNRAGMPGIFITFEGIDGSGKTTQLRMLAEWLNKEFGEAAIITRQPGGTAIGDRIRALLLDSKTENLCSRAELALFFADRAQVIAQVIDPALEAGKIVLCDRWTDSTEAYQAGGRGLSSDLVLDLHKLICGGRTPDLTVMLETSLDQSLRRARRRNGKAQGTDENRFESEVNDFHRRTLAKFLEIAHREPERVALINGDLPIDVVHNHVIQAVRERFSFAGEQASMKESGR